MATTKQDSGTKVVIGPVRLSYPSIFKPKPEGGFDAGKYTASLIIPKTDTVTIKRIETAIEAAKKAGTAKFGGKIPAKLDISFYDGDEADDEAYKNSMYISAKNKNKPGVLDEAGNAVMPGEEDKVYAGCYVRVSLNIFAYNFEGKKGLAFSLGNIMKMKDGEPLSGRASAEDDFAEFLENDGKVEEDLLG